VLRTGGGDYAKQKKDHNSPFWHRHAGKMPISNYCLSCYYRRAHRCTDLGLRSAHRYRELIVIRQPSLCDVHRYAGCPLLRGAYRHGELIARSPLLRAFHRQKESIVARACRCVAPIVPRHQSLRGVHRGVKPIVAQHLSLSGANRSAMSIVARRPAECNR
jgi:hypothetical protein